MDNPILLFAPIAVIVVLAMLLPGWIRRSSNTRARRAGRRFEEGQLLVILDSLGTALDLGTDPEAARRLVDRMVQREPRKYTMLGNGVYGIRFVEPDDAIVRLTASDMGTRLRVEEFREYLGRPNTAGFWNDLRSGVIAEAEAHGIPTTAPSSPSTFERRGGPEPVWRLSG
ncbi:hypothetical protein [Microbacterium hydrocarbonoxydans]|uniref:hypothetical protein n=1 Tax=Microbacterium hydrocarbonoxydans TaxID=273678 RepID=UPI00203AB691|nr:hypothetical protein [Microbacterium hydrocarbonoxydans]MCM3778099.1 hypothetical protein [Microbacterium hydrocarbonoxydans]